MERIKAELKVTTALGSRLTPDTKFDFKIGQAVRVWHDRSCRYNGLFSNRDINGKMITIANERNQILQLRPAIA